MINHKSLMFTGALALLMTSPALAWEGEGRDHGPGYQRAWNTGGDQDGGGTGGSQEGGNGGGKGSGGGGSLGGGGGLGNSGGTGGGGVTHSAPGPEFGVGLSGVVVAGYLWYRRRVKQRRQLADNEKE
jgi:hypothetical protein